MVKAIKAEGLEGYVIDLEHVIEDKKSMIKLYIRTKDEIVEIYDQRLNPYFYVVVDSKNIEKAKKALEEMPLPEDEEILKVSKKKRLVLDEKVEVLKVEFSSMHILNEAAQLIKGYKFVEDIREHDIDFVKRYLLDYDLKPMQVYSFTTEDQKVKFIEEKDKDIYPLKYASFDIEVIAKKSVPNPRKDPIALISLVLQEKNKKTEVVYSTKKINEPYVKHFESEKDLLEAFINDLNHFKPDILVTYNGDEFDIPYIKQRAKSNKLMFQVNSYEPKSRRRGLRSVTKFQGPQHIDAYSQIRFLARLGTVDFVKFDLESVYEKLFNKKKTKITYEDMQKYWLSDEQSSLKKIAEYNKEDSEAALEIAMQYLPLFIQLSILAKRTLFDSVRSSTGSFVESLIFIESLKDHRLFNANPKYDEISSRMQYSFEGAFVKEPVPGLHENIVVVDFRSYHPSIMIAHNISIETLNCSCCDTKSNPNRLDSKTHYCNKKRGFMPETLEMILNNRIKIKNQLKSTTDSKEKLILHAKQHALKILLNSFYGYLGYPRSRYYSKEIVNTVYSWVRHYIHKTIDLAESLGYQALYSDTDSLFLKIPEGKTKKDIEKLLKTLNDSLPEKMELDIENYYKRGIFVTKKNKGEAAKKKYALIDEEDNLKIVGFEYVRRDWANIAKQTQKQVIEAVLKQGNPDEAKKIIDKTIEKLKSGKVKKKDLIMYTTIQKPLDKYVAKGPHISAAMKAVHKGVKIDVGSIVGYIITKSGKTISEKAELEKFVEEGDYDANYYINNQVMPSVEKIMDEFGYDKDEAEMKKQSSLSSWS